MSRKYEYLLLTLILILLSFFYYRENITSLPSHIHSWTQSDRYALVLGYLYNGFELFLPRTFNLSTIGGITAVDLPIHEYVIALLMKIFGTDSPSVFRLYTLIYSLVAYFFLFKLVMKTTDSLSKSIFIVLFVFTCPIIAYYQNGFIPSSTSFASAIIGYYFYFSHITSRNIYQFYLAVFMIAIAALSRSPFHIYLFAVLLHEVSFSVKEKKVDHRKVVSIIVAYTFLIAYLLYKPYLKEKYGSQFLTELMPADNVSQLSDIFKGIIDNWSFQFFTLGHYAAMTMLALLFLIKRKKLNPLTHSLLIHSLLLLAGGMIYFLLMAKQFVVHEYYFIDSIYLVVILLLLFLISSVPKFTIVKSTFFYSLLSIFIGISIISCKSVLNEKYSDNPGDRGEITKKNFINSAHFLDSIGISPSSKILVIDAYSTNMPLILMKRKGYTIVNTIPKVIQAHLKEEYEYVVMQDEFMVSDVFTVYPEIINDLERIDGNGKITIFKYNPGQNNTSLSELLNFSQNNNQHIYDCGEDPSSAWTYNNQMSLSLSDSTECIFHIDDLIPYGPTLRISTQSNRLLFNTRVMSSIPINDMKIVVASDDQDRPFYREYPLKILQTDKWTDYKCMFILPDLVGEPLLNINCYIWNKGKEKATFSNLEVITWRSDDS